jgi:hypothetical protein
VSYRIPRDRFAHETIDGEVVILDQVSGLYYSITGAGADIWALLDIGAAPEPIARALAGRYDVELEPAAAAVDAFVAALAAEGLIEPAHGASTPPAEPPAPPGPRRPWAGPVLEKFSELQTLLVLDPIHDVDESGWPRAAVDRT